MPQNLAKMYNSFCLFRLSKQRQHCPLNESSEIAGENSKQVFLLLIGKNENIFLLKRKNGIYKNNYSNFTVKNVLTMGESVVTVIVKHIFYLWPLRK